MKKGSKYSVRNVKYKYYLSEWILECENTRSYHLNHKTLKLFKPKCLTLSVRNITMLIDFEIYKIWSVGGSIRISYRSLITQSKIISCYEKTMILGLTRVPHFTLYACIYTHTYIHIHICIHMHIHTYIIIIVFVIVFAITVVVFVIVIISSIILCKIIFLVSLCYYVFW